MIDFVRRLLVIACAAALALPSWAAGAQVAPATKPEARILFMEPLTIVKVRDMDFGNLAEVGAGTATIDPLNGTFSTTGGVIAAGGTWQAARFAGFAQGSAVVNIKVPKQPITLTRVGGTETLIVDDFTLDGQSKRTLAASGAFQFDVGATIYVDAGQAEGTYVAEFDVTIQYP